MPPALLHFLSTPLAAITPYCHYFQAFDYFLHIIAIIIFATLSFLLSIIAFIFDISDFY
jgi:hypothetical protein